MDTTILAKLGSKIKGEVKSDKLHQVIYATDASVYRKLPLGVAFPKDKDDLQTIIQFADENKIGLIPRTAGTSLAGQCVGEGLVVDVSKYFNKILHLDKEKKTVTVQPGVIRDELNSYLKPFGLFFGPNTSTSNRCMIGGMVGNNSSGTTSIQYGVTRDKVLEIDAFLSDGTHTVFKEISKAEYTLKAQEDTLEGRIYNSILSELSNVDQQKEIKSEFPKPSIHRRSTGYAVDELLDFELFGGESNSVNLAKLLAGSEGTLAFSTAITVQLDELPPVESVMVTSHFTTVRESLEAVVIAMNHNLYTCELMDKVILDCTKDNREQVKNRFFLEGDPHAILMLEVRANTKEEAEEKANVLIQDLQEHKLGYYHPKIYGKNISKVLDLRKAGLGLLGNIIGDKKAVACIEDTAVELNDLPDFIAEFSLIMEKYNQQAVYYAHAGAGELHLRPILNLKKQEDVELFRTITTDTAKLVKKYKGSFSGEHGDGIVRAEFIPLMIGDKNYQLLRRVKHTFDPNKIFNIGKIVDAYSMDENLRYDIDREEPEIKTIQDFSDSQGILRLAEKCNGAGDCRKTSNAGGTMCPSYRATRDEKDTTRSRANILREFLTHSDQANPFNHPEIKESLDLCLSCKGCSGECPSNVDMAALKAEFLYQYQEVNGYSFRSRLFANNAKYNKLGSLLPGLTNVLVGSNLSKKIMGVAEEREIPRLARKTLRAWYKSIKQVKQPKQVYLFCDEFTNFYDVEVGKDAITVLNALGYEVKMVKHEESGRSFISKGFLNEAKAIANNNVYTFKDIVSQETPLLGIEPSAILTFRDEYLRLADDKASAEQISNHVYTLEEFLKRELDTEKLDLSKFTSEHKTLKVHGHCHQKALSGTQASYAVLSIPENYKVSILATGCCGMAGSFGYEKEHYELSMKVGEDTLFPAVRKMDETIEIIAAGTSCRHQIFDGTKRTAKHPITVLKEALK